MTVLTAPCGADHNCNGNVFIDEQALNMHIRRCGHVRCATRRAEMTATRTEKEARRLSQKKKKKKRLPWSPIYTPSLPTEAELRDDVAGMHGWLPNHPRVYLFDDVIELVEKYRA